MEDKTKDLLKTATQGDTSAFTLPVSTRKPKREKPTEEREREAGEGDLSLAKFILHKIDEECGIDEEHPLYTKWEG